MGAIVGESGVEGGWKNFDDHTIHHVMDRQTDGTAMSISPIVFMNECRRVTITTKSSSASWWWLIINDISLCSAAVDGAVDDHFRKSLGPAWYSSQHNQVQPDSVDDHFARALGGDTWLRIKADHERSMSVPPYPSSRYYPTWLQWPGVAVNWANGFIVVLDEWVWHQCMLPLTRKLLVKIMLVKSDFGCRLIETKCQCRNSLTSRWWK